MKNKNKLFTASLTLAVVILFLILVSTIASASSPSVSETRISKSGKALNPDIYNNLIVWQDSRSRYWHVYMYDLSKNKETQLTDNPAHTLIAYQINPDIYKNNVVWEDHLNKNSNIYLLNLLTKKQTQISKSGKAFYPKIYGNIIVWQDNRSGNWDIYTYNLSTKIESKVSTSGSATNPDINGNRIVWIDKDEYNEPALALYDLSTHSISILGYEFLYDAVIYGDRIIIQTDADNLHMYNLATSTDTTIVPYDTDFYPSIYEDKVAYTWTDRLAVNEIWLYDIATNLQTKISKSNTSSNPKIYENRIVWQDWRRGGTDIYMGTLTYPPIAAFTASPLKGKAPLSVKFTDKSTGSITSRLWNFGDRSISTVQNPLHKYTRAGTYTVSLTVKNAAGNSTATKTISVTAK